MEYKHLIKILKYPKLKGRGQYYDNNISRWMNDYGVPQTQEEIDYIKNPNEDLSAADIAKNILYQTNQGLRTAFNKIGLFNGDIVSEDQRDFIRNMKHKPIPKSIIDRRNAYEVNQDNLKKENDANGTTARWTMYITEIPRLEQLYKNKTGTDAETTLYIPHSQNFGSDKRYNKLIEWENNYKGSGKYKKKK